MYFGPAPVWDIPPDDFVETVFNIQQNILSATDGRQCDVKIRMGHGIYKLLLVHRDTGQPIVNFEIRHHLFGSSIGHDSLTYDITASQWCYADVDADDSVGTLRSKLSYLDSVLNQGHANITKAPVFSRDLIGNCYMQFGLSAKTNIVDEQPNIKYLYYGIVTKYQADKSHGLFKFIRAGWNKLNRRGQKSVLHEGFDRAFIRKRLIEQIGAVILFAPVAVFKD